MHLLRARRDACGREGQVNRFVLLLMLVMSALAAHARAEDVIDLGARRELFVDRYLIDKMTGAELRLHHPIDQGQVFAFDEPWEGPFCAYVTILHFDDKYRAYYRGSVSADIGDTDPRQVTCVADSSDGIHWTKPALDLYPREGHPTNNIVLSNIAGAVSHNFSPLLDTNPNAKPEERFKAVGGYEGPGLQAFASPDGLRWHKMRDDAVLTKKMVSKAHVFDSQNLAFWSEGEGKYLLYYRVYENSVRRIARVESDDFVNWRNPTMMEYQRANGSPAPIEQLYTNQTQPYFRAPHLYISTAARFMPGRQVLTAEQANAIKVNPKYFHDTSDAIFMTSRGGNMYTRTFMTAFVAPGIGAENWVSRTNYPALNVVQTGPTEMSLYVNQNYGQPTANLHRYSMRLDGFASIRADDGGEILTKPLKFDGSKLLLNFATSAAGGIRIEIQDETRAAIKGFALDDCQEVIGNEIERAVVWKGGDLSMMSGKPVRLHFVMKDAGLFALRFAK